MPQNHHPTRVLRPAPIVLLIATSGAAHAIELGSGGISGYEHAAMLRAESAAYERLTQPDANPFALNAEVLLQTRYMLSSRSEPTAPNPENQTMGFDLPRAQVRLSGNLVNRQVTGYLNFDFGDAEGDRGRGTAPVIPAGNGAPQLRDAYVQYNFEGGRAGLYVKAGQFRSAVITEDAIAPEFQMAVERSVANEFFALGLTQGIALGKVTDRFAWEVSVNDGHAYPGNPEPANTAFNSGFEADWAFSGRFDWKVAGDWARFADFTSWRGSDEGLKIGAGFHIQRQGDTNPDQTPTGFFNGNASEVLVATWSADVQWENDGWALFAGYTGQRIMWEINGNQLTLVNHGLVLQGSMFFTEQVEAFGRVDLVQIDTALIGPGAFPTSEDTYYYLTGGVNYYMIPESHAVKLSVDVIYTTSTSDTFDIGAGGANSVFYPDPTVTGLLGSSGQEILVRGQVQLLF